MLESPNVPIIVLKGAAFANGIYEKVGMRPKGDMDLLIEKVGVEEVALILTDAGYELGPELYPGYKTEFRKDISLLKRGNPDINLEMHWHLFEPRFYREELSMAWFWQSAVPLQANNISTLVLKPEAQFLHLCGHLWLAKHAFEPKLLWLNDLASFLTTYQDDLDWDLLSEQAEKYHLVLAANHTLARLRKDWNLHISVDKVGQLQ